jgi:hypothetical protein
VAEREGDDALLQVRPDLVGHPRPATLAHVERLKTPAINALLQAVGGRAVHAHRPAGGRHIAQLIGQREQAQTESGERVMLCHRLSFHLVWRPGD